MQQIELSRNMVTNSLSNVNEHPTTTTRSSHCNNCPSTALVAVPPPARSEVVPIDPAPVEENWDPEPEGQDPASISDEPIIDIEGDDDSNDLGLIDPNAPDEILDDDRSVNEAPTDDQSDVESDGSTDAADHDSAA